MHLFVFVDTVSTYHILCVTKFIHNLHFLFHNPIPSTDRVDHLIGKNNLIWGQHGWLWFLLQKFCVYLAEDKFAGGLPCK